MILNIFIFYNHETGRNFIEMHVLQCSKIERNKLFLLNYATPGIPKEPIGVYSARLERFPRYTFSDEMATTRVASSNVL